MTPILTILIPTMPNRANFLINLLSQLNDQITHGKPVRVIVDDADYGSIGNKRNAMVAQVTTEWICFVDDDDVVSGTYINDILAALKGNPDCCSLRGKYYVDGVYQKDFEHSTKWDYIGECDGKYVRPINHLNTIRTSIVRQIPYQDMRTSEDSRFSIDLMASGLLKTEAWIEKVLYHYYFRSDKKILG